MAAPLYTQQWYMSYSLRAGSGWNWVPSWSCSQAVSKPVWHIPLLCVQWKTPDDGQSNCPKHVEFHSKNKFEKLVRLTLVDFQLDVHISYLFTYNTFIKILYMFPALPCSSSGGLRRNWLYGASGIVTLCRQWRYQRLHIYSYNIDLLKMSRVMLETCRGF